MTAELTPAYILHQRPFRETSVILDVFSEHYGRVSVLARGARQTKKRYLNPYQLFQPLLLSWRGRSELQTVTQVEVAAPAVLLRGNAALCGLYLNELLVRLVPSHEPEPSLFDSYQQTLQQLVQQPDSFEVSLRLFEKQLLVELGYGLQLEVETENSRPIETHLRYSYHFDRGLVLNLDNTDKNTISGRSIQHLQQETGFDAQSLQEIKQLMRTVINYYLGGRPLQSRTLFAQMKQYSN